MDAQADDDIIFETFVHKSGKSHYCLQANGLRYFLDSNGTGQWMSFPPEWLSDGQFHPDNKEYLKNEGATSEELNTYNHGVDFVDIPDKGRVQTQLFENRTRIHCYYDPQEATWIKLPLDWELYSESAKELVQLVRDVCPDWSDELDILALLRSCNYNVDECVNAYHCTIGNNCSISAEPLGSPRVSRKTIRKSTNQSLPALNLETEAQIAELLETVNSTNERLAIVENELMLEKEAHQRVKKKLENERIKSAGSLKSSKKMKIASCITDSLGDIRKDCQAMRALLKPTSIFKKQINLIEKSLSQFKHSGNRTIARMNELKALYRQEVEQRRNLYNTLIELRGNIRVFCRMRPSFETAVSPDMLVPIEGVNIAAKLPNSTERNYQFDKVFSNTSTQEMIFDELRDIITSVIDGYNVCILAYGQTGSGKTFTMQGPPESPGVNIRALRELLRVIKERSRVKYKITVSMVEIYNENIVDLISPSNACEILELRNLGTSVIVMGASWVEVGSENEINQLLSRGAKNRHVASTKMNSTSSRSHLIVSVCVTGTDAVSGTVSRGSLILCDLAGSERSENAGVSKGERFVESTHINMSLSALGQVFTALRNNQLHVPYRNSKLTQILQPCLGGDAKACLIVNVSSEPKSLPETLSTLLFGASARQVTLGPAKAHVTKVPEVTA